MVDIFSRSIDQLGSDKLEVRLGAIHTLKRISQDPQYREYRRPILEALTAFVRERTRNSAQPEMPVDIQEIVDFLSVELSEEGER